MLQRTSGTPAKLNPAVGTLIQENGTSNLRDMIGLMGARFVFESGTEIFAQGEPAQYIYMVRKGCVRLSKLLSDGRRQIGAFYLPDDIFGLDAEEVHPFSAEAISDSEIVMVKRNSLVAEAIRIGEVARDLWGHTVGHLQRAQGHLLLLGRKTAQEKIGSFLLEMAKREEKNGSVELPMSRQDIADYLGLSIETVSRTFRQFERDGVIAISGLRHILLNNRNVLDRMNEGWVH